MAQPAHFFGPVAKNLGLSDGATVDYQVLSKLGDPKRDFYVTQKGAVFLSIIWKSGASRRYTSSKDGLLVKAMDRNGQVRKPLDILAWTASFEDCTLRPT